MELQLKELIERIRKDGAEAAAGEAEEILASARAEAEKIVADAQAEAEGIVRAAKEESERTVKSGEDALRQAGRNLLLSFRESVTREMNAVVRESVDGVYSGDAFAGLLLRVLETAAENPDADGTELLLSPEDYRKLEGVLLAGMTENMKNGLTLRPDDRLTAGGGFRVALRDGGAYYDYSAEAVAEMLSAWLNPNLTRLLREAEKEI